jgi:cytochrome oxidase Cu insertion factor (SCO1/SenC/PrrC family)
VSYYVKQNSEKKNLKKVVKKLSKRFQNNVKTCQKVVKKLSKNCQKLSKSSQKVVKVVITFDPTKQKKSKSLSKSCQKHWQHRPKSSVSKSATIYTPQKKVTFFNT